MNDELVVRLDHTLTPDPKRVIAKLFVAGEDAAVVRTRAQSLIDRIALLAEQESARLLGQVMERFGDRHEGLEDIFLHHFDLVRHRISHSLELSRTARLLLGAYFTHEYAVEAAALCNPSMVIHPDQSGLAAGQLRAAVSLRQIGEGHLSSIGFVTAVLGPAGRLDLVDRSGPLLIGQRTAAEYRRDLLAAGLEENGCDNEISATVLGLLPERYDDATFDRIVAELPVDLTSRSTGPGTVELLRRINSDSYATDFPPGTRLEQQVLWPSTPPESNGMEDARFVLFTGEDGPVYRATYTAYDGRQIAGRELVSTDLRHFEITPMRGQGARNKGVALFPRPVGGRQLALCRSDGETIGLTTMDHLNRWRTPVPLHTPRHTWELIQVGNCGSPIETEAGWLVLTHGVGPMRRYAIGALLLDLDHPERVLAELAEPLLSPDRIERDGYVPNVVYSCGGLIHDGDLWLPYGASDARVGFATVSVDRLLAAMTPPSVVG
ncbi:glycoside hydrolase family 130 protein [Catenuloplanes sp. NPDC051500]|uniref:glycoside hydrolase family 130 protein n=1 Tax=Catenuloplanes sp. NPDC051500 TaxID=3363959 RepID=UPI0037B48179